MRRLMLTMMLLAVFGLTVPAMAGEPACTYHLELTCEPGYGTNVPTCWGDSDWRWVRLTATPENCIDLVEDVTWSINDPLRFIGPWHRPTKVPTAVWQGTPCGEQVIITANYTILSVPPVTGTQSIVADSRACE